MDLFQILSNSCSGLGPIISVIKGVLNLVKIGVPILLILMGSIDLGKAVLSSDDKEIKGATGKLVKRAIAAVAVFFATTIVTVVMNLVSDAGVGGDEWSSCWNA